MLDGWEFVAAGYGFTIVVLAVFGYLTVRKGKRISSEVPPSKRRFLE